MVDPASPKPGEPSIPRPTGTGEVPERAAQAKVIPARHHYRFLDGVRAYLALYVVAGHCLQSATRNGTLTVNPLFHVFYYNHFAVCIFIVLSGFCLSLPVLKMDLRLAEGSLSFFKRRAQRILPPYYLAAVICLVLAGVLIGKKTGTQWDLTFPVTIHVLVSHLLLINNFFQNDFYRINYVFWSIAVEWQIYFFFPLLLLFSRRVGTGPSALIVLVAGVAVELAISRYRAQPPYLFFIGLFALGIWAADLSQAKNVQAVRFGEGKWLAVALFLLGVAIFILGHPFYRHAHVRFILADVLVGAFGAVILMVASLFPKGRVHAVLSIRPCVLIGSFAYSLYLLHAPVLQFLWQYPLRQLQDSPNAMAGALLVTGLGASVLLSYLFYLVGERPFIPRRIAASTTGSSASILAAPKISEASKA